MYRTALTITLIFLSVILSSQLYADSLYEKMEEGESLYGEEKYDESLSVFVDAQIEAPEDIKVKYNIASSHYKMKNYEEAVKGYLDVAATAQDAQIEETALYNTGNAMYRQGKLQEAVEYFKKALELDPEDKDAQHNLEFVREEIKKKINESKKTEEKQKQQEKKEQQQEGQCESGQNKEQDQGDNKDEEQNGKQEQTSDKGEKEDKDQDEEKKSAVKEEDKEKDDGQSEGSSGQAAEMTKGEAEQWLNSLQEDRDKFKKQGKQKKGGSRARSGKDW